jgi:hypothetical protein
VRLQYEIATTGQDQLRSVLRGVEREAAASDKRLETQRRSIARTSAREQAGLMHGPGRKEQLASIRQSERAQSLATARQMREQAAANRLQQRSAVAAAKGEERAKIQSEKNVARARDSLDRQRSRALLQQHNESERAAARVVRGRRALSDRIGGGMARSVTGAAGAVATIGGAAAGIAGGFAAADALRERSEIQRRASALANQAGDPSLKGQLAEESTGVRGFTGSETLGAMGKFVGKTGDLEAARASIKGIGELTVATDGNFEEMGEAAGNAFNVIADAIEDPKKRLEALHKVMAGWAGQGNIGTVEMKDMAAFGGRLGGSTRKFSGDPADLLLKMGAMSQAAARAGGASDAAEATEGVARFASDLTKKPAQKALAAMGVNVFADKGNTKLNSPDKILADILDKTKGSLTLGEDVMNAQSGKVLGGFSGVYTNAEAKKKGTGKQAVLDEFERYNKASLTPEMAREQANSRLSDPDMQLKEAAKTFNDAVGRELAPVAVSLAHQFAELVPLAATAARMFGKMIGFLTQNPFSGIGLIVGAAIVKDIATAGISALIKGAFSSAADAVSKRGGGSIDPDTGEFKASPKMAAAGMGAAIGITIASAIITAGVVNFEKSEQDMSDEGRKLNEVRASNDPEFIRKQVDEQRKRVNKLKAPGFVGAVLGQGAEDLVDGAVAPNKKTEQATAEANLQEMETRMAAVNAQKAAADKLSAAADKLDKAAGKQPPAGNRSAPIVSPDRGG